MKNITVIGVGYVGLVSGACFADLGNRVTCLDINEERIENLKQGIMPIYEIGLEDLVERNVAAGRLFFTTSYEEALQDADFVFIAVGTPSGVDGEADLRYVRMAAETIADVMDHSMIIINKSTVPVGTGDWVTEIIRQRNPEAPKFAVVSCPEFLREGSAINDFMNPDRIVLGSTDLEAAEKVAQLHLPLRSTIMITDLRTAEMIKYASNAFLATKISFINEMANICEALGAVQMVLHSPYDRWDACNLDNTPAGRDKRVTAILETLEPALIRARDIGVQIVLENIKDTDPADRLTVVEAADTPALALSVDTGHAHWAHSVDGAPPVDRFISSAGARLGHVHLQDTDGWADRHWPLGEGNIVWPAVFKALAGCDARPHLVVEINDFDRVEASVAHLEALGLAQ